MKKIYIVLLTTSICSLLSTSCKESIDELYNNPDKLTTTTIESLFTNAMLSSPFSHALYGETWWFVGQTSTISWTNSSGWLNFLYKGDPNGYSQLPTNGTDDIWNRHYLGVAKYLVEMEILYNNMPAEKKGEYKVYITLGSIMKAYNFSYITDMWGDVPYSQAMTARTDNAVYFPKFDKQQEIYYSILGLLKTADDELKTTTLNQELQAHRLLTSADYLMQGDLLKWRRFTNSLRLRLGMRLSEVDPDKAKEVMTEVIGGNLPVIETNEQNETYSYYNLPGYPPILEIGQWRGLYENRNLIGYLPNHMLTWMKPGNDPRLPIFYNKGTNPALTNGEYIGCPFSADDQANEFFGKAPTGAARREQYAFINVPIILSEKFPNIAFTSSETHFLIAEAIARGWATGNAEEHYNLAIQQSIEFYAAQAKVASATWPTPTQAEINTLLNTAPVKFETGNKAKILEQIATQKWIHYFIWQPYDAWIELRRTDMPDFGKMIIDGQVIPEVTRVFYPVSESINNIKNFGEVAESNTINTRVWWDVKTRY